MAKPYGNEPNITLDAKMTVTSKCGTVLEDTYIIGQGMNPIAIRQL